MSRRLHIALLLLLGVACSKAGPGGVGQQPPPGPGQPPRPGANPPAPGADPSCTTTVAFQSPLRRLTRVEYNNTVRDLLGDSSAPADRFPPDEVSGGFSNNAAVLAVSPLLAEKYQEAAETLAAVAVTKLATLFPCDLGRTGEEGCARAFIEGFGRRAYRRPLDPAQRDRLLAVYRAGRDGGSHAEGIELTLRALLQAPAFLYRLENAVAGRAGDRLVRLDGYETATRLSYFLWGSMPDDRLFTAAERDQLRTPAEVAAMARLMLADPRARPALAEFFRQWLGLGVSAIASLGKDPAVYPAFDDDLRAGLALETSAFVTDVMFAGDRKMSSLLLSPRAFVTPALARLYGAPVPRGDGPQPVSLPAAERAGLLTQAAFLSVHALPDQSSPVHRGKVVREQVLCQEMPPQPPNLMVSPPEVDPSKPTRERFAQHATDAACAGCHKLMDPIGFGFERYDGIGRFRSSDGGRPVDDTGELHDTRDANGTFQGARALAERLAGSGEVSDCLATQLYRFGMGRLDGPGDACSLRAVRAAFAAAGGDLQELVVALASSEAFLHRPALNAEPPRGSAPPAMVRARQSQALPTLPAEGMR